MGYFQLLENKLYLYDWWLYLGKCHRFLIFVRFEILINKSYLNRKQWGRREIPLVYHAHLIFRYLINWRPLLRATLLFSALKTMPTVIAEQRCWDVRDWQKHTQFSWGMISRLIFPNYRDGQKVQHFKVLQDEMGKYFVWLRKFDSINQLIDYHRRTSISRDSFLLLVDRQPSRVSFDWFLLHSKWRATVNFGEWYFLPVSVAFLHWQRQVNKVCVSTSITSITSQDNLTYMQRMVSSRNVAFHWVVRL